MTFADLSAFVAVADTGSVVAASAKLNLTQPAVTRRVQNLERALGETLFDRNSKPQKPTAAGWRALAPARRLLASAAELQALFGCGEGEGNFRFGATPRLNEAFLVQAVSRLKKAFPKLVLHASTAWSKALLEQVQTGSLDAAAISTSPDFVPPAGVESHRLGVLVGHVVVARDDALPASVDLAELAGRSWILNNDGCSMREILLQAHRARGLPFDVAVEAAGVELQLALVAKGAGLGFVTEGTLERSPHRKAVRVIKVRNFKPKMAAILVYRPVAERLRGVIRCLQEGLTTTLAP